jgi:4a-hydroxytetrahydrobiopterin dehydratase
MHQGQLAERKCAPCQGDIEPLKRDAIKAYREQLSQEWRLVENHHLEREFKFKNFRLALEFVNKVGELAEAQGHHPDIYLTWGKVQITLWTHKVGGLHENNFILATKIDRL